MPRNQIQFFRSDWILELAVVRRRLGEVITDVNDCLIVSDTCLEKLLWVLSEVERVEGEMRGGVQAFIEAAERTEAEARLGTTEGWPR